MINSTVAEPSGFNSCKGVKKSGFDSGEGASPMVRIYDSHS